MAKEFAETLPLGGDVKIRGDSRIYTYRGFTAGNTRRCAVGLKGDAHFMWIDRNVLSPASGR